MTMTVGLFERFVGEMDSLRAERVLDAAQAACAPQQKQEWWDALLLRAQGTVAMTGRAAASAAGFAFNGVAVSFDALYTRLSGALGGGVSH